MNIKSLRINVCCIDEEGRFGGPEYRITQVAKALTKFYPYIETHVVYPKDDSTKFAQELLQAGISKTALNITRLSKEKKIAFKYFIRFIPEVMLLYSLFRKEKFDLVQVNGSQQFKGALAAKMAGIPVIWVLEDALMADIVKKTCRLLAKHIASGIIVVGQRVYDYYIRGTSLESKTIIEIHPPVDTAIFDADVVEFDKNIIQIPGKKIVTVSGINPTKGLEFFIEMASHLTKKHQDLYFLIAAPNFRSQRKYYQSLMRLVNDSGLLCERIKFLGMIDDVPSFLKSGDIFVFTSVSESGPMAVWEAMSMGKAIVTTDVGSVNQYIVNGESGFIVPVKDPLALCEKVEILLNDPALGLRIGEAAKAIAQKNLDISIIAEKYAHFYRKILSFAGNKAKEN